MEPIIEEKYHGYVIRIAPQPDVPCPREYCDNFGKMVCFHKRYDMGDKGHGMSPEDLLAVIAEPNVIALPLYLLDHSGLWMNTTGFSHVDPQRWDWGQLGYIYADIEAIYKEFDTTELTDEIREKARKLLEDEVAVYNRYLTGEVFGYVIEDPDGELVDSCWGYYQDPQEVLEQAKAIVEKLPYQPELPVK